MSHDVEGLKRYIKKKGLGYFLELSPNDKNLLDGILFSNGTINYIVLHLLFS